MIVTTTPTISGHPIIEYQGIVFGEVIAGINMMKDIGANFRNMFGGRSGGYEKELKKAREDALVEMMERAEQLGANAIVGVDFDYEILGTENNMLMVTACGTAVYVQ